MIRKYESMIVIASTLGEDAAKKENEKVLTFVKENGGEVISTDEWGKRKLAYQIKRNTEGYYFINNFNLDADAILELERIYRLSESIIRSNVLVKS
ncbi:MAG: 30S ribosomal protein S6 [Candidatus Cloacimonetes bacterium]|nr:30S ribosomal protein S6 [Candidatus Cloacimonadota bacterium]